jgi:RimJ/RimL family protein N-acetyltransferase
VARSASPWLNDRPPELIPGAGITLRRWSERDLDELVTAVNDTIDELRPWMPWAGQPASPEGMATVLGEATAAWEEMREFSFVVSGADAGRTVVGCCGLHARVGVGALEIGYWVRSGHTGQGIATEAARVLTRSALALQGVERVEIHCDAANTRSAAIPPRLGFRLDRVEHRPPEAPGETERHMIWTVGRTDRSGTRKPSGEV